MTAENPESQPDNKRDRLTSLGDINEAENEAPLFRIKEA